MALPCPSFSSFPQTATALHFPLSAAKQPTRVEQRIEELKKGFAVWFMVLTFNSALVAYLLWGDVEGVASVGVTYVLLLLLFARRFGCWEPGSCRLEAVVGFLCLSLTVLLAFRLLARAAPPSTSVLLVAAAGATALGVGGCCAHLLHRRSWSKQQRQKIILPLVQESRS